MKNTTNHLLAIALFITGLTAMGAQSIPSPLEKLVINEVNISEPGIPSAQREYIEIFDGGTGQTPLNNVVLVMYDGETDRSYYVLDLSPYTTNANGYFLIGDQRVTGGVDVILPNDVVIRDKTGGIALYQGNISQYAIGMPIRTSNILDAFVFEETGRYTSEIVASVALRSLLAIDEIPLNEDNLEIPPGSNGGRSFQRYPNGSGGARKSSSYSVRYLTTGTSNGGEEETPILGFTLVSGETEQDIVSITDGMTYPLNNNTHDYLNIRVETKPNTDAIFKSYVIRLEGPETFSRIENVAPYALFGDKNGDYFGKLLPEGTYELMAIPYTGALARGKAGIPVKITFEIKKIETSTAISSFSILRRSNNNNSVSFTESLTLEEGMNILFDPEDSFAIIANTVPEEVGSVRLSINGTEVNETRLENFFPYTMFGNIGNSIPSKKLPEGAYTISATPYEQAVGNGVVGIPLTLNFTLELDDTISDFTLIENPIRNKTLQVLLPKKVLPGFEIDFTIYNGMGTYITRSSSFSFKNFETVIARGQESISIDLSDELTDPGLYILQIEGSGRTTTVRSRIRFVY